MVSAGRTLYATAMKSPLEIFLVAPPGLEPFLAEEAAELGFAAVAPVPGGVTIRGDWHDVARANRELRGATRVLARVATFRAMHLAQLDKRARKLAWATILRPDMPFRVEVVSRKSRIYHARAAEERIARAIAETAGAPLSRDAEIVVKGRIEDDLVTLSLDTSGAALHLRGHKEWVGKAPMRETTAAMILRACGFAGAEPVLDPMCGSGTFVLEAAEIAMGLAPGRSRDFAFEHLAVAVPPAGESAARATRWRFHGRDRDAGAIRGARANAVRSGVAEATDFDRAAISDLEPPPGPPGLIVVNPPYGARIGSRKALFGLYGALGAVLTARFGDWRLGLVTADDGLARATGLRLDGGAPIAHGGIRIRLWRSAAEIGAPAA